MDRNAASERRNARCSGNARHHEVGHQVRQTMKSISGTVPEKLPAEPSLKRLKPKRKPKQIDGTV